MNNNDQPRRQSGPTSLCALAVLALAGCGSSDQDSPPSSAAAARVSACAIAGAADPAAILGEPTDAGTLLYEISNDSASVSQCLFTGPGGRTLALLVRTDSQSRSPASRQAVIDGARADNTLGVGEDTARALAAGKEIENVGELALFYELLGHNLMLWQGNHQLTITLAGFDDAAEAEAGAVRAARAALAQL